MCRQARYCMPENSCHVIFWLCMYICLQKVIYCQAPQQEPKFKWMEKPIQTKANFKAKTRKIWSHTQEAKGRFEAETRDMARVSPSRTDMGMGVGWERVVNDTVVWPIPTHSPILMYFYFISGVKQSFGKIYLWTFLWTLTEWSHIQ